MSSATRRSQLLEITGFNQLRRDRWVAELAARVAPGTRVLDAGAGYGRYRDLFKHCAYQAQDFGQYRGTQDGVMQDDWRYTKLDYECDITAIPAPDGSFDVILCTEVLEHLPAPILAVREFARLLRPGGEVWLSAPLGSGLHQEPYHYYGGFTPHWYQRWLAEAGFTNIFVQPNGGFFLHQAQESSRMLGILLEKAGWARWDPRRELCRFLLGRLVPRWLAKLEARIPVPELTVGYFVTAIRIQPKP